ncbi:MAG: MBL fold metallo-hydrolase [Deltaproteobacteria bacterium]|nr:MBL fold metallo-hydrolase [Deltaproteobacteria bacterium]
MGVHVKSHTLPTPYLVGDIHLYEVDNNDTKILIDTGPPTKEAVEIITAGIELDKLDYVLITHCHHDHFGLVDFISEHSNAKILLSKIDKKLFSNQEIKFSFLVHYLQKLGFEETVTRSLKFHHDSYQEALPDQKSFSCLEDNPKDLEEMEVSYLSCPSHTQSDIVYILEPYVFTGDTLLRDIFQTPLLDLDLQTLDSRFNNYQAYCESIGKLLSLSGLEVKPAHREFIESIQAQITFYVSKMLDRSQLLYSHLIASKSLPKIVGHLFPEIQKDPFRIFIKISEVLFLIDFMLEPELLFDRLRENSMLKFLEESQIQLFDLFFQEKTRLDIYKELI